MTCFRCANWRWSTPHDEHITPFQADLSNPQENLPQEIQLLVLLGSSVRGTIGLGSLASWRSSSVESCHNLCNIVKPFYLHIYSFWIWVWEHELRYGSSWGFGLKKSTKIERLQTTTLRDENTQAWGQNMWAYLEMESLNHSLRDVFKPFLSTKYLLSTIFHTCFPMSNTIPTPRWTSAKRLWSRPNEDASRDSTQPGGFSGSTGSKGGGNAKNILLFFLCVYFCAKNMMFFVKLM